MRTIGPCLAALIAFGCSQAMAQSPSPRRDINLVVRAHDKERQAIPGVTGVYVGVPGDGNTALGK